MKVDFGLLRFLWGLLTRSQTKNNTNQSWMILKKYPVGFILTDIVHASLSQRPWFDFGKDSPFPCFLLASMPDTFK